MVQGLYLYTITVIAYRLPHLHLTLPPLKRNRVTNTAICQKTFTDVTMF